jgi:hypothetical protein
MRRCAIVVLVLFCGFPLLARPEWPSPHWDKVEMAGCWDGPKTKVVGAYRVRIVQVPAPDINDRTCRAYLVDGHGHQKLLLDDFRISIYQGTGADIFGEGHPALVLEGWSGGAHCCWTYSIVDLGAKPSILPDIGNEIRFFFFKDRSRGRYRVLTYDGAFDYFDDMCHACSPLPKVVLEVNNGKLRDVSSQYVAAYDHDIAKAMREWEFADDGEAFRDCKSAADPEAKAQYQDARGAGLEVVLSYLYSGRDRQAWQALDELWPVSDKERMKKLILDTRRRGILSNPNVTQTDHIPPR